jgi:transcriptional regulator with PAS, ATPase and Fis domain
VERLLRKARELRAQAEREEQEVHATLTEKKAQQEQHIDELIDFLLGSDNQNKKLNTKQQVVEQLKTKKVSMDTLEKIVDRLDDRQMLALGQEQVQAIRSKDTLSTNFQRVKATQDEKEAKRLEDMTERLLEAVAVLDEEFRTAHANKKTSGVAGESTGSLLYSVSSTERSHWGGGQAETNLRQRLHEKQRARHEQFRKRQEEFYEAQRINKKNPPPPKVKDDHGFLP